MTRLHKSRLNKTRLNDIRGFTLLEILIAVLVFSIGLLALAKLQITSLRLSDDSLLRSTATILANDMAERLRSNPIATQLGTSSPYNNPNNIQAGNPNCLGKDSNGNANNSSCTSTQMALHDFYEWNANLQGSSGNSWFPQMTAALPNGAGVVCIDSTPHDGTPGAPNCDNIIPSSGKIIYAIKVWWTERKDQQTPGVLHQYILEYSA